MQTTILFIRHATTEAVGQRLVGRQSGVHLNDQGRMEAQQLASALRDQPLAAVISSPLERALETARHVADGRRHAVEVDEAFNEIDFGRWTGLTFDVLRGEPGWSAFNERPAAVSPPGGEPIAGVSARTAAAIERLRRDLPDTTVAIVSHGDVIRLTLAHLLGLKLDDFRRLTVDPASITRVDLGPRGACVQYLNHRTSSLRP